MPSPTHNGNAARVVAFVERHPCCTRRQMLEALGLRRDDSITGYCVRHGLIFAAGTRGRQRYFASAELAAEAQQTVDALIEQSRKQQAAVESRVRNLRQRARRQASGRRLANTRPSQSVHLDADVVLPRTAKLTIEFPKPGRWASAAPVPSVIDPAQARPWAQFCAASMGAA